MGVARAVGVALIGVGGHQLSADVVVGAGGAVVETVDVDGMDADAVVEAARAAARTAELVSVCVTPRHVQVAAVIAALDAGRHVLIERPSAATVADFQRLTDAAGRGPGRLWERATTPFDEPFRRARELIASGILGDIVLVTTHRSYPWAHWRASDEQVSGGLVLQSAGYGLDVVRFVAGQRVRAVRVTDTAAGEPRGEPLRMAAVLTAELEGGGVASIVVDYLNPAGGPWGRDEVRILGTLGRMGIDAAAGAIEWTDADGEHREMVRASGPGLASEVIAAVREGRDTDPPAAALRESTALLLRAMESRDGPRRSFVGTEWA